MEAAMNTTISQREQNPQIFISMTILLVLVTMLGFILKTSPLHNDQTSIHLPSHQVQVMFDTKIPITVPVQTPPLAPHWLSATPVAPAIPQPVAVPQPVPVPVPSVP
jgi:hypothetical protein